jgi:amino acid transporter
MSHAAQPSLNRHLKLPLVTFYGLGTIIGAGIYVLVGEVARNSGTLVPLAFLCAAMIASLTGACYAELCCRFPKAAGAALYIDKAFQIHWLSQLTGFLILLTGVISAATISRGFVGYLHLYWQIPPVFAITGLCLVMGTITSMGIKESAWAITLITLLEVAGLFFVLGVATWDKTPIQQPEQMMMAGITPLVLGVFLAFYAFIGFEDMVNLAEEVQEPERTLPRAIGLSIGLSSILYIAVAVVGVLYVDLSALAESGSPLAFMVSDYPAAVSIIGLIGMVAITNGALTQIIMASRMLYGMARRSLLPKIFAQVSERTHTPVLNTWLVTATILGFALFLPLATLAKITSAMMLVIFIVVNLSLIRVRKRYKDSPRPAFQVWPWVAPLGIAVNLALLGYELVVAF